MRLNCEIHDSPRGAPPLVIGHGLFGAARNWGSLARRLSKRRRVIAVDLRNHGESPWRAAMGYRAMAADLAAVIRNEAGGRADLLGHSMGGKVAMAVALSAPDTLRRLVVADIAPVPYDHAHGDYIAAMRAVDLAQLARRSDAEPMLAPHVPDPQLRAFLLQNIVLERGQARWRLNLEALQMNMDDLLGFPDDLPAARWDGPALFLRGGASDYVRDDYGDAIRARFPAAAIETIPDAGHWLHAEKPEEFLEAVERFLAD